MAVLRNGSIIVLSGQSRSSVFSSFVPYRFEFHNSFNQVSVGHKGYRNLSGDTGGAWYMNRIQYDIPARSFSSSLINGQVYCPAISGWTSDVDMTVSDSKLKADGTKAIALTAPTNPSFNLSQSLGEVMREGLPSMFGSGLLKEKTRFLRGSGKEYLNVEFGWKPLMRDLQDFARVVQESDKTIAGYRKGSDQKIRRRLEHPPVFSQRSTFGRAFFRPTSPVMETSGSSTETRESKSWFSGAFRYHIPVGTDYVSKAQRYASDAGKLLGLRLTPDTVWNLAPWSWAADWFANTGDIMTNISNLGTDGLVMQYGYSMSSVKREETCVVDNGKSFYRRTQETKRRMPASPYGFNLTFDGLSNRQKAICAAIGITRGR